MLVWPCAYEVPLIDENKEKELKIWVGEPRKSDVKLTNLEGVVY